MNNLFVSSLLMTIKSKAALVICIILSTLLTASYISGRSDRAELIEVRESLTTNVALNKRLSDENLKFAKELNEAPKEYIKIVKEVMNETCNGEVKQTLIESMATQRENNVNEKVTADIDDNLPPNLILMLK